MNIRLISIAFILAFYMSTHSVFSQNDVNSSQQIKDLIAKKRAHNKTYGFGFRIQLYNGTENRARSYRAQFRVKHPNTYSKLKYDNPEWKVHVGNYKTRLEADKALINLKKQFSGSLVVSIGS